MTTVTKSLLTVEEYARMPDPGYPTELVRGEVVGTPFPGLRHGQICSKIGRLLGNHVEEHDLGYVISNNSGVITERAPDSVRGPDLAYYSFGRVPRGPLPDAYLDVPPELVFEVVSPSDRWNQVLRKVGEYLEVGVALVCVVDQKTTLVHLFRIDDAQIIGPDDAWSAPEILGEFRVPVRRFFE